MSSFQSFQKSNAHLFLKLSPAARAACREICGGVAHLRSRRAMDFFASTLKNITLVDSHPLRDIILDNAVAIGRLNWVLVSPFFSSVGAISPDPDMIQKWARLAGDIAEQDVDVALAFLNQTPQALTSFGEDSLLIWGGQALEILQSGTRIWKAAEAYLVEAAADRCATPLSRWRFFLEQAARITQRSPEGARVFIQHSNRVCLLLNDAETQEWVSAGLTGDPGEQELVNYFSGTSLKAMQKRDRLASGAALKDRATTLTLICEACLGRPVKIRSNSALVGSRGFSGASATDGRVIYLPDTAPDFEHFKLMALHQAMLLDCISGPQRSGKSPFDPVRLHLEADKILLKRLPGLFEAMRGQVNGKLPASYPLGASGQLQVPLPWWGDILPELIDETQATIEQLRQKAGEYRDVPPELVEALLAGMMAEGQREADVLWQMLREIFDNIDFTSPDPEELQENVKSFFYKEWDQTLTDYKLDWCLVRQRPANDDPNAFVADIRSRLHGIIALIRRQFMRLKPERFKKYRAQPAGDALDIDALVQALVDKHSGSFLSENVYIRRDKRIRDVAVLFLLDMSGSTAEKISGRRVIDIQKEAMALMAEALDSLGDPYAIYGFQSEGRFRVDFMAIKDFGEFYTQRVQHRLGNLAPGGLTRLGAVIRHAAYKFENIQATVKLMVILTDGRPYDLEYGTMDYAIADSRKAIQEARRKRIHPFIITSDKKGTEYLKQMAPQTQSIVLSKAELLPSLLPAIYKRLTV